MRVPFRLLLGLSTPFLFGGPAIGAEDTEIDYRTLFRNANRSATLWKEKAKRLEEENAELRERLENAETKSRPPLAAKNAKPRYEEFHIEIPNFGVSNLEHYGGPSIKINVWKKLLTGANLQIGSASIQKFEVPLSGRLLIYRDSLSGDEVYLTNRIASTNKLKLLVRRRAD